ncbi:adenylate/guanylate cyclase domain-containing protein [Sanyastnella coralliicola]|uniref:adenylate/guanylate cyclase domain-containing protein n=1 Tax=Sanyastnella coralliicola TaxID=3069118 RepID=UPI0027BAFAD1|nr:adenylate/guanylate cyclase domain-containing protein [Longitalea sp. SCSIO 12813]
MQHFATYLLGLFSLLFTFGGTAQVFEFNQFGPGSGFPSDGAYAIAEDELGRLYVGSEGGGLVRFDGFDFEIWDHTTELTSDTVRSLFFDSSNQLFIGTDHRGLWKMQHDQFERVDTAYDVSGAQIRAFAEFDEQLWVGTKGEGLFRVSEDSGLVHINELDESNVRCLLVDGQQQFWIGTDHGLYNQSNGNYILRSEEELQDRILALFEDNQGRVWVGHQNGLSVIENGAIVQVVPEVISHSRIRAIEQDEQGHFWIGTRIGAFEFHEESGEVTVFGTQNGLSNDRIRDIHRDRSGSLWFATYFGGICQLTGQSAAHYTLAHGFPETSVVSLVSFGDSLLFFNSIDGDLYQWKRGDQVQKMLPPIADEGVQATLAKIEANQPSFATLKDNQEVLIHEAWQDIYRFNTFTKDATVLNYVGNEKTTAFVTEDFFEINGDRLTDIDLACGELTDIAINDSLCFVGSSCGLFAFAIAESGNVIIPKRAGILPIEGSEELKIIDIEIDSNDNVWMATERQGIFRYGGKVKHYSDRYLSDLRVSSLHLDPLENLWVVTRAGIDFIELDPTQEFVLNHESYGNEEGIDGQINDVIFDFLEPNTVWLATTQGLIRFDPEGAFINEEAPGIVLDGIRLNYESVDWSVYDLSMNKVGLPVDLTLPYDANHLSFDFDGFDLSQPEDLIFQCRLEGLEEEWVDLQEVRSHTYPQIPPGDYTFQLRARNSDGFWNEEPLSYAVKIKQPFWMNPLFIAVMAIGLFLAVYGFVQYRLRRLRRANERLERTVLERTEEVRQEKEKSEALLLNILPKDTAEELKEKGYAETKDYDGASVLFSDLKGFTSLSEKITADELVGLLDEAFKSFDRLCDEFGVEKIKTIGDAYMCATGIPREDPLHAENLVRFAFGMLESMKKLNQRNREKGLPECDIRIGIHSGPLIAGVVGERKFAYDIWGDTVNTAARMESSGEPARINISASTFELVKEHFNCESRGKIQAKNKGELEMYFVVDEKK